MKNVMKYTFIVLAALFIQTEYGYSQFTNYQTLTPGIYISRVVLGDIDSDGDLDLIMIGGAGTSNYFKTYKNNGTGSYSFHADISPGVGYGSIALGDIDSDGDLDLVITGEDGTSGVHFKTYKNDSAGNYSFYADISPGVKWSDVALGDIDLDGDLDLVMIGSDGGNHFKTYKNDGNGSYSFHADISPATSGSSIVLGDIDSDGDLDLIMTGYSLGSRYFKAYKNEGDGNYSFYVDIVPGVNYPSIAMGDIDSDGDLDLITTGSGPGGVFKSYKNTGTGTFTFDANISPAVYDSSIALGDMDSDGDLDLIMIGRDSIASRYFKTYTNNGNGSFSFNTDISPGSAIGSITMGDIDSDGDLDLIMTGHDGSDYTFKTYKNTNTINNDPPSVPTGMSSASVSNNWRLSWNSSIDDHTSTTNIRYHIAIGTNSSGTYDYISTNIMFPIGQANLGSVPYSNFYQSKIPVAQECYWKVCSIDSAFQSSNFCAEQTVVSLGGKPENFYGVLIATNKIRWRWDDNATAETNYFIKDNSGIVISPLLGVNATNWIQTNLLPKGNQNYMLVLG